MNTDGLQVDLVNGQITVTRPATNDTITYRKSEDAPHLELAHSWISLGPRHVRYFPESGLISAVGRPLSARSRHSSSAPRVNRQSDFTNAVSQRGTNCTMSSLESVAGERHRYDKTRTH